MTVLNRFSEMQQQDFFFERGRLRKMDFESQVREWKELLADADQAAFAHAHFQTIMATAMALLAPKVMSFLSLPQHEISLAFLNK